MSFLGLEPNPDEMWVMGTEALKAACRFEDDPGTAVAARLDDVAEQIENLLGPPPETPGELTWLLNTVSDAAASSWDTSGPRCFAKMPGSQSFSSALGEMLSYVVNRHTAFAIRAPALAAMEQGILRWLCTEFGLGPGAGGILTSGGSMSTLTALAAARSHCLGDSFQLGTVYLTSFTHDCVPKVLRVIGIQQGQIRVVPTDSRCRMDPLALEQIIAKDRERGLTPFLLVATAGTTDTGAVDPMPALAEIARREQLWFHVDAAYGGFFQLTDRGRETLRGIEHADSLVLDPHKSLFLSFGTSVLLMRNPQILHNIYGVNGAYLQDDLAERHRLPNRAELGIELTTEFRGMRLWLPLHLHGIQAFRAALDEKLDLAEYAYHVLARETELEVAQSELSTLVFRLRRGDRANQQLLAEINSSGNGTLSSTTLEGRLMLRMCILNVGTHREHLQPVLDMVVQRARSDA